MLTAERGFSLVETLVAMAAGVMVLATVLSLFIGQLASGNTNLHLSRLNQEIQGIADVLSRDIQRAGFHPAAVTDLALNRDLATAISQHLVFSPVEDLYPSSGQASCIRLKFWEADAPAGEQLVVRIYDFQESSGVLRLHLHHDVQSLQPLSALCGLGNQLISSKEIRVNALSFALTANSQPRGTRSLALLMTASFANRPTLAQTLHRQILLRNQGRG